MASPLQILQSHRLRITDCRLVIIQEFLDKNVALSHADLEDTLNKKFDRVTIYRTLKTFLEKDLIHKVLDDSGADRNRHIHVTRVTDVATSAAVDAALDRF